jgi:hypothetical protein
MDYSISMCLPIPLHIDEKVPSVAEQVDFSFVEKDTATAYCCPVLPDPSLWEGGNHKRINKNAPIGLLADSKSEAPSFTAGLAMTLVLLRHRLT